MMKTYPNPQKALGPHSQKEEFKQFLRRKLDMKTIRIRLAPGNISFIENLIWDETGFYRSEVKMVQFGIQSPTEIWIYMPEGQKILDALSHICYQMCGEDNTPKYWT